MARVFSSDRGEVTSPIQWQLVTTFCCTSLTVLEEMNKLVQGREAAELDLGPRLFGSSAEHLLEGGSHLDHRPQVQRPRPWLNSLSSKRPRTFHTEMLFCPNLTTFCPGRLGENIEDLS